MSYKIQSKTLLRLWYGQCILGSKIHVCMFTKNKPNPEVSVLSSPF